MISVLLQNKICSSSIGVEMGRPECTETRAIFTLNLLVATGNSSMALSKTELMNQSPD